MRLTVLFVLVLLIVVLALVVVTRLAKHVALVRPSAAKASLFLRANDERLLLRFSLGPASLEAEEGVDRAPTPRRGLALIGGTSRR